MRGVADYTKLEVFICGFGARGDEKIENFRFQKLCNANIQTLLLLASTGKSSYELRNFKLEYHDPKCRKISSPRFCHSDSQNAQKREVTEKYEFWGFDNFGML